MATKLLTCIDPGHGGYDPGAIGVSGIQEKVINLAIALYARNYLQQQGIGVIMTRDGDYTPNHTTPANDLQARCDIANQAGASLFVSIHENSATNREAMGTEVYYFEGSMEGLRLANLLNMYLYLATNTPEGKIIAVKETDIPATAEEAIELNNRGVKASHFYVLRKTTMPAVLVETAFISNPEEEKWLSDVKNQELVGKAIAKAICQYLGVQFMEQVTPERVVDWLVSKGVINSADYWKTALLCVKNLDALFVKLYQAFREA